MRKTILSLCMAALPMLHAMSQDLDAKYATTLLKPGTEAPDFRIPSIVDGDTVSLGRTLSEGDYVILDFWASWCSDCRREIPTMKGLMERYAGYGLKLIGISYDTDAAKWRNCVEQFDMPGIHCSELKRWHHGTTTDTPYGINWVPTFYLIAPDGTVVIGTVEPKRLEAAIEAAISSGKMKKKAGI